MLLKDRRAGPGRVTLKYKNLRNFSGIYEGYLIEKGKIIIIKVRDIYELETSSLWLNVTGNPIKLVAQGL